MHALICELGVKLCDVESINLRSQQGFGMNVFCILEGEGVLWISKGNWFKFCSGFHIFVYLNGQRQVLLSKLLLMVGFCGDCRGLAGKSMEDWVGRSDFRR